MKAAPRRPFRPITTIDRILGNEVHVPCSVDVAVPKGSTVAAMTYMPILSALVVIHRVLVRRSDLAVRVMTGIARSMRATLRRKVFTNFHQNHILMTTKSLTNRLDRCIVIGKLGSAKGNKHHLRSGMLATTKLDESLHKLVDRVLAFDPLSDT